ncbi:MAG: serine dehydratase subunit alpha family protein [Alistipes sp.]|nr:serine dehydratase subunit alpha family protein [Candidatus Alistipes equi]
MTTDKFTPYTSLLHEEVVPAIGCTEPIAVALCATKAREILGEIPLKIKLSLSANIYKNAMGVGIPNTGMTGLPIAVAMGIVCGESQFELEVLKNATEANVIEAKSYLDNHTIEIGIEKNDCDVLYINCIVSGKESEAECTIKGSHTHFVFIRKDHTIIHKEELEHHETGGNKFNIESLRHVYDYAMNVEIKEIEFLQQSADMNMQAAEFSFRGEYGHSLGKILKTQSPNSIFGNTLFTKILSYTSGACDARMSGALIPVMSNSGSGNQGISATIPVVLFGKAHNISREKMLRALALSHLTVIYLKQHLGRLSALCGCVVAATGSSCAITYLMGGDFEKISFAVKNMAANITGMICDGAKPSCSLKVTSGVATAVLSATLAMNGSHATKFEGIVDEDVDRCIQNMTDIGRNAMHETDNKILQIMTSKV